MHKYADYLSLLNFETARIKLKAEVYDIKLRATLTKLNLNILKLKDIAYLRAAWYRTSSSPELRS